MKVFEQKNYIFYPSFLEVYGSRRQNGKDRSWCREIHWKAVCVVLERHNGTRTTVVEVGLERMVKRRDISEMDSTGFGAAMCSIKSSPDSHRKPKWSLLPVCPSSEVRLQHTCNARVSWEGSVENIKTSLAHGRGDQVVLEGRYHTAGAAGWHGPLRVRVVRGAECLQLPVKSWNASTALSYCQAQLPKIIPTQLDPHSA